MATWHGLATVLVLAASTSHSDFAMAEATLADRHGKTLGQADLEEGPAGIVMRLEPRGLDPGMHALHLHQVGQCEAPATGSRGGSSRRWPLDTKPSRI